MGWHIQSMTQHHHYTDEWVTSLLDFTTPFLYGSEIRDQTKNMSRMLVFNGDKFGLGGQEYKVSFHNNPMVWDDAHNKVNVNFWFVWLKLHSLQAIICRPTWYNRAIADHGEEHQSNKTYIGYRRHVLSCSRYLQWWHMVLCTAHRSYIRRS